jgi:hypothetical protein
VRTASVKADKRRTACKARRRRNHLLWPNVAFRQVTVDDACSTGMSGRVRRSCDNYRCPYQETKVLSTAVHMFFSLAGKVHVSCQLPSCADGW